MKLLCFAINARFSFELNDLHGATGVAHGFGAWQWHIALSQETAHAIWQLLTAQYKLIKIQSF